METRTVRSQRHQPAGVGVAVSPTVAAGTERSAHPWFRFFLCRRAARVVPRDVGERRKRVGPSRRGDSRAAGSNHYRLGFVGGKA
jgi:hypothetical protein